MMFDRREFVVLSALGFVGSIGNRPVFAQARGGAPQPPAVPEFKDVRRNVGTFTARGGTIGYLVTADAVVVIDSSSRTGAALPRRMKPRPRKIRLPDQLAPSPPHRGNKVMSQISRKLVAHAKCQAAAQAGSDVKERRHQATPTRRSTRTGKPRSGRRRCQPATTGRRIPAAISRSPSKTPTSCTWAT